VGDKGGFQDEASCVLDLGLGLGRVWVFLREWCVLVYVGMHMCDCCSHMWAERA
jgi:hypothetical protein